MKTIIIGGGPAGLMAAIKAADAGEDVLLIEHNEKIGRKLLATGNGRCNLSNDGVESSCESRYSSLNKDDNCFSLVSSVFSRFGYEDTMAFFKKLGLITRNRDGLIYPYSDQASAVLDVLRFKLRELGVTIHTGEHVKGVKYENCSFNIMTQVGSYSSDRLILATGSKAQPKLGSDGSGYDLLKSLGHSITQVIPGLVQLRCRGKYFKSISGVRVKAVLTLKNAKGVILHRESGELQLTDYGISGIAVMNLSNRLLPEEKNAVVEADFLDGYSETELADFLLQKCRDFKDGNSEELLIGVMPKKLGEMIIKEAGISFGLSFNKITNDMINKVVKMLKGFRFEIEGTNSFNEAQICRGGVPCGEVDENLQSKKVPGLYIVGELMDVHGDCGGFNLQWCWSSGAIAGAATKQ